jgi:hypothetical protein
MESPTFVRTNKKDVWPNQSAYIVLQAVLIVLGGCKDIRASLIYHVKVVKPLNPANLEPRSTTM